MPVAFLILMTKKFRKEINLEVNQIDQCIGVTTLPLLGQIGASC